MYNTNNNNTNTPHLLYLPVLSTQAMLGTLMDISATTTDLTATQSNDNLKIQLPPQ